MRHFISLFLLCHATTAVKHSLKFFFTATSGLPNLPDFFVTAMVDETVAGYCDTKSNRIEPKQDWAKTLLENEPDHVHILHQHCVEFTAKYFKITMNDFRQRYNQSEGVHILQRMNGCEWDDETGEITGFNQFGYDGEDFISFDLKTSTWIAPKQQAVIIKHRWDAEKYLVIKNEEFLTNKFPAWLKMYLDYGRNYLLRTELPSVSLLQKTPSSPVSCHATGFYPVTASLVWRKDGQELDEGMDHGEILPNPDGTFQTSVDLDLSSVKPEEWSKYDCMFQLSGVKDDIVTKLETNKIRSNQVKPVDTSVIIIISAVVVVLVIIAAFGFMVWKKKKDLEIPPPTPTTESVCSTKSLIGDCHSDSVVSSTGSTSSNKSLSQDALSVGSSAGSTESTKQLIKDE